MIFWSEVLAFKLLKEPRLLLPKFVRRYGLTLQPVSMTVILITSIPASAQTRTPQAFSSAPADHLLMTAQGVDLRSGSFNYSQTDLSIGEPNDAALQLTRIARGGIWGHLEPFGNLTHNHDIKIAEKRVNINDRKYNHGTGFDFRMIVRVGSRSDTFDGGNVNGPYFENISNQGIAKLTFSGSASSNDVVYTYRATNGTTITFRPLGSLADSQCSTRIRCAYASSVEYPDGTRFDYAYETGAGQHATRLRRVTSNRGYALIFEYGGPTWQTVTKACTVNLALLTAPSDNICPANAVATASYAYTMLDEPRLASVTDPTGGVWGFQHSIDSGGLKTIGFVKPGGSGPWLINHYAHGDGINPGTPEDGSGERVHRQVLADGRVFHIQLANANERTEGQIQQVAGGDIEDAQGRKIRAEYGFPKTPRALLPPNYDVPEELPPDGGPSNFTVYQITPGPAFVEDQLGRRTTYNYCDPIIAAAYPNDADNCAVTPLRYWVDPEGIRTDLTYDGCNNVTETRRRAKPGSGLADLVVRATFHCWEPNYPNKPVTLTDARGSVTNWTYDSAHGGVLREELPADANGIRPVKRFAYAQRSAWVVNGGGGYQPMSPVWVRVSEKTCRTSATIGDACAAGAADEVVTMFDYGPDQGPNNLLLRGQAVSADGVVLRTCYSYDAAGNRIGETSPRAGLAVCP